MQQDDGVRWFAGVDWGSRWHQVCLLDATGEVISERRFEHDGSGLTALCDWLLAQSGAEPGVIAVVIEVPHGPVVEMLLERGFLTYAINPKQLDRFRDRFSPAGAKDDARDAHVLGDAGRTDRHRLRRLDPVDPAVVELRGAFRLANELTEERGRLVNRLRDQLWHYHPQMLKLRDEVDVGAEWFLALWQLVPTPDKAARVGERSIARRLARHRVKLEAAEVRRVLRAPALQLTPGTVNAAVRHIHSLLPRLQLVNRQLGQLRRQLDALTAALAATPAAAAGDHPEAEPGQPNEQSDLTILRSLPGAGRIVLAGLLGEANEPLRRRDYHALRTHSGVAPVTRQSGDSRYVLRRYASNRRLSLAVFHWARTAVQRDARTRSRYAALRAGGHSHGRALRSIGDGLLRLACAMLRSRTVFDADRYAKAGQAIAQRTQPQPKAPAAARRPVTRPG